MRASVFTLTRSLNGIQSVNKIRRNSKTLYFLKNNLLHPLN